MSGVGLVMILAIVKRVLELVFPYNQISNYPNFHHRAFMQSLTETDAVIHRQALGELLELIWRRRVI